MTLNKLFIRSLWFYRRTNLCVLLSVAVAAAVLVGAGLVGDSVSYSLGRLGANRLGEIKFALEGRGRFFRAKLADDLSQELDVAAVAALQLRGSLANDDGSRRAPRVVVLGVGDGFWRLGPGSEVPRIDDGQIILNEPLADKIGVSKGDEVLLRVGKPSLLSREAPLSTASDMTHAVRLTVSEVVSDEDFGRFSLEANQISPLNAYVNNRALSEMINLSGRANLLLLGNTIEGNLTINQVKAAMEKHVQLADFGLELRELAEQAKLELRTQRIFLEQQVIDAVKESGIAYEGILSYFVNKLRLGNRSTPYSMVAAMESSSDKDALIVADLSDDEIIINDWLADDLQGRVGDIIELSYFVPGPMRRLEERSSSFRVRKIVAIEGASADRELMPEFEGLSDEENCRDWEPGIPIDLDAIRDKDEEYWNQYRGTPKAFVRLSAGKKMWSNRFVNLTAIRFDLEGSEQAEVEKALLGQLSPESFGLYFRPVRELARAASTEAMDFGGLFLGFSFFLVVSALLLTGLMFVLGLQQRREEVGILLAIGLTRKQVRYLWLMEAVTLAVIGAIVGAPCGMFYTKMMLYGLTSIWRGAIGGAVIYFHAEAITILIGSAAGIVTALLVIVVSLRYQERLPARELLCEGNTGSGAGHDIKSSDIFRLRKSIIPVAAGLGALLIILLGIKGEGASPGAFFAAGSLLLLALILKSRLFISYMDIKVGQVKLTLQSLAIRNCGRRRGRSLAVIAMLACGSFIVIAVGANRHDPLKDVTKRSSGTGGFALIGETTIPVYHNLNRQADQKELGLSSEVMKNVEVVHFRVRDGDDASCFNMNRAQLPRILAVQPEELQSRGAFGFVDTIYDYKDKSGSDAGGISPWLLLDRNEQEGVIPAIADQATIKWALGKDLGGEIGFIDDQGQTLRIRLVGALKNSVLQGNLIIAEDQFVKHFPSQDGYRMFLIDCPAGKEGDISNILSRSLRNEGLDLIPTGMKLTSFYVVESTYLSIFQLLGGLGLVLGSVGLAVVVMRNVLERRGELAMLRAVGFGKVRLMRLIIYENVANVLCGLFCGVTAALVAIWPALREAGGEVPVFSLSVILVSVALCGILYIYVAAALALAGELLPALRNE